MGAYRLIIIVLALVLCSWLVWRGGWRGVYIVGFIVAAYLVERWSARVGLNPLLAVALFVAVGTYVGFRVFPRTQKARHVRPPLDR